MMTFGGILQKLAARPSRFSFSNTNYDNWNSNTNCGSHLSITRDIDPANKAKNHDYIKRSVGTFKGKAIL